MKLLVDRVIQELAESEQNLKHRRFLLAQRLNENYRRGNTSYTQVLLKSRSLHDMLSRGYYVRRVVASDKKLVAEIKQDVADIAADKKRLEVQSARQEGLKAEFEAQKEQLAHDLTIERHLYNDAHHTRVEAQQELDDLETEAEAMSSRIRELSNMHRQREEAKRRARAAELRNYKLHHKKPPPVDEDDNIPNWGGGFIRPCAGRVTSGFGSRYHPVLHYRRMHSGVDFGAPHGAPIHAAAPGVVIMASYNHGYGNCVIIDHGNGTTTLYGHASSLLVSEGQRVRAGQTIARVGATGLATGPHLHFEVRHNGTPVQPPF